MEQGPGTEMATESAAGSSVLCVVIIFTILACDRVEFPKHSLSHSEV